MLMSFRTYVFVADAAEIVRGAILHMKVCACIVDISKTSFSLSIFSRFQVQLEYLTVLPLKFSGCLPGLLLLLSSQVSPLQVSKCHFSLFRSVTSPSVASPSVAFPSVKVSPFQTVTDKSSHCHRRRVLTDKYLGRQMLTLCHETTPKMKFKKAWQRVSQGNTYKCVGL